MADPQSDMYIEMVKQATVFSGIPFDEQPCKSQIDADQVLIQLTSVSLATTKTLPPEEQLRWVGSLLGNLVRLRELELAKLQRVRAELSTANDTITSKNILIDTHLKSLAASEQDRGIWKTRVLELDQRNSEIAKVAAARLHEIDQLKVSVQIAKHENRGFNTSPGQPIPPPAHSSGGDQSLLNTGTVQSQRYQLPHSPLVDSDGQGHDLPPVQLSSGQLKSVAKCISFFDPEPTGSTETHTYLEDIEYHLAEYGPVDATTKVKLICLTASRDVVSFIRRQSRRVAQDWNALRQAIIDEYADSRSTGSITSAILIHQGHDEQVDSYYTRLRMAFFGYVNTVNMEEDLNFKALFIANLHPSVKKHIPLGTDHRTKRALDLRRLAREAFSREHSSSHEPKDVYSRTPSNSGSMSGSRTFSERRSYHGQYERSDSRVHIPPYHQDPSSSREQDPSAPRKTRLHDVELPPPYQPRANDTARYRITQD